MEIVFIAISIVIILVSQNVFKKKINPCSIYASIWIIDVLLYCMKGLPYKDLSIKAIIIIILFELFLCTGIMIGEKCKFVFGGNEHSSSVILDYASEGAQNIVDKFIIITMLVSSISIISALMGVLSSYSISNILTYISSVSQIYQGRATGDINNGLAIFGSAIYVTIILVSFQISRGRFKLFYITPILLSFINAVNMGGRNAIVYTIVCISIPYLLGRSKQNIVDSDDQNRISKNKKKKVSIIAIGICIVFAICMFLIINSQRAQTSRGFYHRDVMTAWWLVTLTEYNPGFLTLYSYFTGPLSYLNNFLDNPFYSFGANTFYVIFRQLSKLGLDVPMMTILPFGTQTTNVGTYITELIIDFGLLGGVLFAFFFGICFGIFYRRTKANNLLSCLITTSLYICVLLSFFMWYLRTPVIWLTIIYGIIIISLLNKSIIKKGYVLHCSE